MSRDEIVFESLFEYIMCWLLYPRLMHRAHKQGRIR